MYRIQRLEPIHVPSYHLARKAGAPPNLANMPLHRTLEVVISNLSAGCPQYVALIAHEVVGWCNITHVASDDEARRGELEAHVNPAYRGQGIGSALVVAALTQAQSHDFSYIALEIDANDVQATHFYQKFGFTQANSRPGERTWILRTDDRNSQRQPQAASSQN
jgi:ribosomal protein S18 acetylase RimI-like enzyme